MIPKLTLSVVDQSPMRQGETAADALRDTIELAAATESMGYKRYWLAEHHSLPNFAGTSPEVLIGLVAARTKTIHVGAGGIMLSHYSSFKVAENFRMLASLYPGRIDLGVGRAPGSDQMTMAALSYPNRPPDIPTIPGRCRTCWGTCGAIWNRSTPFLASRQAPALPGRMVCRKCGCLAPDTKAA